MKIIAGKGCEGLAQRAYNFINSQAVDARSQMSDMTLHIGLASDPAFKTPAHARDSIYVGDSSHIGNLIASTQLKAQFAKDPKSVVLAPKWNSMTGKWDEVARQAYVGDSAPDYLSAQAIAPWAQGIFKDVFERPLLYSHASDLVKLEQGTNPWCEVMNLYLADYAGGPLGPLNAGSPDGNMSKDVSAKSGFMTAPVINIFVTYTLTVEELEGAKVAGGNPFGEKLIQGKIKYANYMLQMLTDYLTYYGNDDTDTVGLFNVNTITATASGDALADILADTTNTTKGSTAYQKLSKIINDFFSASYNKFDHVKVGLSTYAYNLLSSMPYSDAYEAKSVLAIFNENYIAGETKEGKIPRVEFYADPLLDANTDYNQNAYDYMVITAPEIGLGPEDTRKNVILQGMPLKEFVYPVIPGQINTQHRMLRRYAGIYAPVTESVKVISGFGKRV
jgi:hypothetical protein